MAHVIVENWSNVLVIVRGYMAFDPRCWSVWAQMPLGFTLYWTTRRSRPLSAVGKKKIILFPKLAVVSSPHGMALRPPFSAQLPAALPR